MASEHSPSSGNPTGVDLIAAERARQIAVEGWTPDHDDEHFHGELLAASDEYVRAALRILTAEVEPERPPIGWPWHPSWWKPSEDPIRNLVKAGALIAAEIDRLQRASDG